MVNLREFHRNKLGRPERIVQVGDVVVVYKEDKKRGEWKLGIVESLVTGKDGIVQFEELRSELLQRGNRFTSPGQCKSFIL